MLTNLSIRNIVLIAELALSLKPGLCVLTGETGAGKSILLDALGLVLGARSEARLVRRGEARASVSANFDISMNARAKAALEELGIETENELRLRRTLTADGKTRCFINDTNVGVGALKEIGDTLLEIHGQHDGRGLLDTATHRVILDEYGETAPLLVATQKAYEIWRNLTEELARAKAALDSAAREKEYLQHMQKELSTLAPEKGEEEILANVRSLMMQSEKLVEILKDAENELTSGKGASAVLSTAQRILLRSSLNVQGRFSAATDALERAITELGEAQMALSKLRDSCEYDPAKLERNEERLFALRAASRKYNVPVDELSTLLAEVNTKLSALREGQHTLAELERKAAVAKATYRGTAAELSKARSKSASTLEKAVSAELEFLKMGSTTFVVQVETQEEDRWAAHGVDKVQFQAATNKGNTLAPLHKIASGGELSRFMLAMKVALARVKSTPTLIFDEIDTGTGGAVADAIGQRLAQLAKTHQLFVVTHLPQVAARGDTHLLIRKEEVGSAVFTHAEMLKATARKEELARMLAGAEITAEARRAAHKLLQAAG